MKRSFRDPNTGVLKAVGFCASNEAGDLTQPEADDFNLEPGKWRWDGTKYVAYVKPPLDLSDSDNMTKILKAVLLCVAQVGGLTPAQARTLFKQKYDSLA